MPVEGVRDLDWHFVLVYVAEAGKVLPRNECVPLYVNQSQTQKTQPVEHAKVPRGPKQLFAY